MRDLTSCMHLLILLLLLTSSCGRVGGSTDRNDYPHVEGVEPTDVLNGYVACGVRNATDRSPAESDDAEIVEYGDEQNPDLQIGEATVTIPSHHIEGEK